MTVEEKRERAISDAIILFMKDDVTWFNDIRDRMDAALLASPDDRTKIILDWIKAAEKLKSDAVKEQILNIYNNG